MVVLKNGEIITDKQLERLNELKMSGLNLKTLRAMNIRIAFQGVLKPKTNEEFTQLFKKWYFWATHSQIVPDIKVAKSFKKHYDGISISKIELNNGILEGLNSMI